MRVLVAISILAFAALLWASIAIYRHIRRTQRRRRRALEASLNNFVLPQPIAAIAPPVARPVVPEITFSDPEAPLPEVAFTDPRAPIRPPAAPAFQPYVRQAEPRPQSAPVLITLVDANPHQVSSADEFVDTLPPPPSTPTATTQPVHAAAVPAPPAPPIPRDPSLSPIPAWPHFGFTPAPRPQPAVKPLPEDDFHEPARSPMPSPEPIPYAAPPLSESSATVAAARGPIQIQPPAPAIRPLYPSSHPTLAESTPPPPPPPRQGQQPMRRADWSYFNKDMGDLSDPPPAGSRPRIRIPNSE
jgi:hypothetical protein